ncbi:hypothetical protein CC80DRAFT_182702 [Byssothecium circinans]|uniref:Uncharacterized protein n=1 Tax=Byssothecium circinans TaxID=147558 RepID=A0A6A5TTK7_9PLEO|nr:hypothetical protein CC80DRAFT_182702 [Byssothecium circinans]
MRTLEDFERDIDIYRRPFVRWVFSTLPGSLKRPFDSERGWHHHGITSTGKLNRNLPRIPWPKPPRFNLTPTKIAQLSIFTHPSFFYNSIHIEAEFTFVGANSFRMMSNYRQRAKRPAASIPNNAIKRPSKGSYGFMETMDMGTNTRLALEADPEVGRKFIKDLTKTLKAQQRSNETHREKSKWKKLKGWWRGKFGKGDDKGPAT